MFLFIILKRYCAGPKKEMAQNWKRVRSFYFWVGPKLAFGPGPKLEMQLHDPKVETSLKVYKTPGNYCLSKDSTPKLEAKSEDGNARNIINILRLQVSDVAQEYEVEIKQCSHKVFNRLLKGQDIDYKVHRMDSEIIHTKC